VETEFEYNGMQFRLIDVGGQRTERKKWIHCFEGVTAVIFVAALSEYDLTCYEDDKTKRMVESLILFDEVCNSRYFQEKDIILFFNKVDLFKEKIERQDLKISFENYKGGCNFDNALKFIEREFKDRNQDEGKEIYTHFTCATDTNNVASVFGDVKDIILKNNFN
jgi:GTPase SAR1 family protein